MRLPPGEARALRSADAMARLAQIGGEAGEILRAEIAARSNRAMGGIVAAIGGHEPRIGTPMSII